MKDLSLSAILLLITLVPASQAQKYKVVDLGTLGGSFSAAAGVNNNNVTVGSSSLTGDIQSEAFAYSRGVMKDLGTLGGNNSLATAINAAKTVVGAADLSEDPVTGIFFTHAFVFKRSMTDIGSLGGNSQANGISVNGLVAGYSTLSDLATQHAFLWSPVSKKMTDLGTLSGGSISIGNSVNSRGIVAGASDSLDTSSGTPAGLFHATLFTVTESGPAAFDLGTLGGLTSQANFISELGVVVGQSDTATGTDAFLWAVDNMVDLGNLGGSSAAANSINRYGEVVGTSNTTGDADIRAFLWTVKKGMVDLNTLISPTSGWDLQNASSINDHHVIVGTGLFTDPVNGPESHAFKLIPVE